MKGSVYQEPNIPTEAVNFDIIFAILLNNNNNKLRNVIINTTSRFVAGNVNDCFYTIFALLPFCLSPENAPATSPSGFLGGLRVYTYNFEYCYAVIIIMYR